MVDKDRMLLATLQQRPYWNMLLILNKSINGVTEWKNQGVRLRKMLMDRLLKKEKAKDSCSFSFNWSTFPELRQVMPHLLQANLIFAEKDFSQPQPFYGPFSGTTRVSRCQKRTSGLYGAREDQQRQTLTIRLDATQYGPTSAHLHHPPLTSWTYFP